MKKIMNNVFTLCKNFYNKLQFRNKDLVLICIAILFVFYLDFVFILRPKMRLINKLSNQIAQLQKEQEVIKKDYHIVETFPERVRTLKEKAYSLNKKILPEEQRSLILEDIEQIANRHHIKIISLNPTGLLKEQSSVKWKEYTFYPFTILVNAKGGYHQFAKFINDIEKDDIFFKVQELNIKSNSSFSIDHDIKLVLGTFIKLLRR